MKDRIKDLIWNSIARGIGLAVCIGIVYVVTGLMHRLPCWLGAWFPSVTTDAAWGSYRDKDQGCFTIANVKVRPGKPLAPVFRVQAEGNAYSSQLNLFVHRANADNSRIDAPFLEHHVGDRWKTRYCFDMPGTVGVRDKLLITGHLVHRRWFGIADEPVPSITLDPVN